MSEKFKRIPRSLPDPRKRKRKLRRRKDAESSYAAKPASAVFTGLILALLVGVSLLMFGVLGIRHWNQPDRVGEPAPRVEDRKQTAPPVVWQGLQPGQIADKFLAATTPQERLRWVRQPGAVADLMERFYRDGPGATEKVADFQKMPQGATDDQIFVRFAVTMTDGSKRLLCVPFD